MAARSADSLPTTARAIALLLAAAPGIQDTQPGVLHQLLEFAHRYTSQVLTDAIVYAEHAGRSSKIEQDDVTLAVQARVGWEFGGRVPKEYILSLATEINAAPLPAVPEVFGVRLPPPADCLANVDFDLVPNQPPPEVKLYDEEVEEIEESESESEDEDVDMEPAIDHPADGEDSGEPVVDETPFPISAVPTDMELLNARMETEEGSGADDDEDGLFAGGDEEDEESDGMEEVATADATNGVKRKLVEEDDYD